MADPSAHASTALLVPLAGAAGRITLERVPELVRRQAGLCILDTVGCMAAATRTEEARLLFACELGETPALATVVGTAQRSSVAGAIKVNGYLGDVLELNDLIGGHASIGIVTAALALAEARQASGAALLEAVIRGIEVTARVYDSVYPSLRRFTEMALVPVGIPSSIGAAAAAARLLDLDATQTAQAMAIAAALAGWCPAEVIFGEGGTVKPMLFGAQPALAGVTAANYAQAGMTGPLHVLEGKLGYFATAATDAHLDTADWAERWALAAPRRKLHACCGYLHAPLDAAVQLRQRIGAKLADGVLEVHVPAYTADVVNKERAPVSANDARFHLQYCLALAVVGADVIEPAHSIDFESQLARSEVKPAMARIHVAVDAGLTHYHQCRIVVRDASGGNVAEQSLTAPRGSAAAPLSDDEVLAKFMRLAGPVLQPARAERFAASLPRLHGFDSLDVWLRDLAV